MLCRFTKHETIFSICVARPKHTRERLAGNTSSAPRLFVKANRISLVIRVLRLRRDVSLCIITSRSRMYNIAVQYRRESPSFRMLIHTWTNCAKEGKDGLNDALFGRQICVCQVYIIRVFHIVDTRATIFIVVIVVNGNNQTLCANDVNKRSGRDANVCWRLICMSINQEDQDGHWGLI